MTLDLDTLTLDLDTKRVTLTNKEERGRNHKRIKPLQYSRNMKNLEC